MQVAFLCRHKSAHVRPDKREGLVHKGFHTKLSLFQFFLVEGPKKKDDYWNESE